MNNPKMNQIIDRLYARNHVNVNEGFIKDRKELNKLSGEFEKFLNKKKFYFGEMGVDNGKIFVEIDGDWKHEHLYFKQLAKEFFEKQKGHEIAMGEVVTQEHGDDSYVANHYIAVQESVCEGIEAETTDTIPSEEEAEDEISDEDPYNAFMKTIQGVATQSIVDKLGIMLKRFSSTSLCDVTMTKIEPSSGFNFFEPSRLVVFILNEGLSTDEENRGLVAVLILNNGKVHLIDTEVLENNEYYINTMLYNLHQLEDMSNEVWVGDVVLK